MLIAAHAMAATIALLLGGVSLRHRPKGDRMHRRLGRVWAVAMYWTVLSSFAIKRLRPGHFSWIHLLSIFTLGTLTIGVWAAATGRIETHRRYMTGSYFGLLGAFLGALAAPVRDIPQLAAHHPLTLVAAGLGCVATAAVIVILSRGDRPQRGASEPPSDGPGVSALGRTDR